jgi:hypothetical protein
MPDAVDVGFGVEWEKWNPGNFQLEPVSIDTRG